MENLQSGEAVAFVWENFGPTHIDRCEAVADRLKGRRRVVGIELAGKSDVYDWRTGDNSAKFDKLTLFPAQSLKQVNPVRRVWRTVLACLHTRARDVFFCHYESPSTLISASILRLLGRRTYVMTDSKFDDYARRLWREVGKAFFFRPYLGALVSATRASEYLQFFGMAKARIRENYDTLSLERVRRLAGESAVSFADRHFTIVARFVPKKNLLCALEAYSLHRKQATHARPLHICGGGPEEQLLRARVSELGLGDSVTFRGFVQTEEVCKTLGSALALLLPSVEEQFGLAVIEALAVGVPVIISDNCGVRDRLVRSGVNGFVVEPDNPAGVAFFMHMLCEDEKLWTEMSRSARVMAEGGDCSRFAASVEDLIDSVAPSSLSRRTPRTSGAGVRS